MPAAEKDSVNYEQNMKKMITVLQAVRNSFFLESYLYQMPSESQTKKKVKTSITFFCFSWSETCRILFFAGIKK